MKKGEIMVPYKQKEGGGTEAIDRNKFEALQICNPTTRALKITTV